jgi:hypothetical protein
MAAIDFAPALVMAAILFALVALITPEDHP